ncbi:MAG: PQQ-binding-like beta-propeller repeat protein [Bryobacteraceae bacterium]
MRLAGLLITAAALAADWPEWRGAGRQGIWTENGIVDAVPTALKETWRVPVRAGYSGPAVARGRVFLLDFARGDGTRVEERAVCLDERSGKTLWTRAWEADYRGLDYANGPRATPSVDGDNLYVLGAMGSLRCLRVRDGSEVWSADFVRDFAAEIPGWGTSSAPLVAGENLIAVVGGRPDAKVVAFDKRTGAVKWKALSGADSEIGYSQPVLIRAGRPQVIVWHAGAIDALDPETGRSLWSQAFRITMNTPIATPAWSAPHLLVSGFFDGARMMDVGRDGARLAWGSESHSEIKSDKLHTLMSQPIIEGDYVYGVCSYGQLRCLRRTTGERVWETQALTVERARNVTAWLVRQGERVFALNDRGELVTAHLSPEGYQETSRVKLIEPTSKAGGRRELGAVVWSHPAFANRHIVLRNDREAVRFSLAVADYDSTR